MAKIPAWSWRLFCCYKSQCHPVLLCLFPDVLFLKPLYLLGSRGACFSCSSPVCACAEERACDCCLCCSCLCSLPVFRAKGVRAGTLGEDPAMDNSCICGVGFVVSQPASSVLAGFQCQHVVCSVGIRVNSVALTSPSCCSGELSLSWFSWRAAGLLNNFSHLKIQ